MPSRTQTRVPCAAKKKPAFGRGGIWSLMNTHSSWDWVGVGIGFSDPTRHRNFSDSKFRVGETNETPARDQMVAAVSGSAGSAPLIQVHQVLPQPSRMFAKLSLIMALDPPEGPGMIGSGSLDNETPKIHTGPSEKHLQGTSSINAAYSLYWSLYWSLDRSSEPESIPGYYRVPNPTSSPLVPICQSLAPRTS